MADLRRVLGLDARPGLRRDAPGPRLGTGTAGHFSLSPEGARLFVRGPSGGGCLLVLAYHALQEDGTSMPTLQKSAGTVCVSPSPTVGRRYEGKGTNYVFPDAWEPHVRPRGLSLRRIAAAPRLRRGYSGATPRPRDADIPRSRGGAGRGDSAESRRRRGREVYFQWRCASGTRRRSRRTRPSGTATSPRTGGGSAAN